MRGATEQLMQPHHKVRALCYGDPAFTGHEPSDGVKQKLAAICRECEIFFQCLEWAETFKARDEDEYPIGATQVFAAGEWRQ